MSPWFFNVYMDAGMKEVKMGMGRRVVRLTFLLYVDDLVLHGDSEEDLREIVGLLLKCIAEEVRKSMLVRAMW